MLNAVFYVLQKCMPQSIHNSMIYICFIVNIIRDILLKRKHKWNDFQNKVFLHQVSMSFFRYSCSSIEGQDWEKMTRCLFLYLHDIYRITEGHLHLLSLYLWVCFSNQDTPMMAVAWWCPFHRCITRHIVVNQIILSKLIKRGFL